MAERFINSGYGYASRLDNLKQAAIDEHVISGCSVDEESTPAMGVDVTAGVVFFNGDYVTVSGVNKTVTAAHASLNRKDIISVNSSGTVTYTEGSAAANPFPADLPNGEILLAVIDVDTGDTAINTGDINDTRIIKTPADIRVPIGTILPWNKTMTGVPTLPEGYAECDGSVISDAASPMDGETLPDLNGTPSFLRGNTTSGSTGGAETHTHSLSTKVADIDGSGNFILTSATSGSGSSLPTYYEVVYIMRIK